MPKISLTRKEIRPEWDLWELKLDGAITPQDMSEFVLPEIDFSKGFCVTGAGPIWLYSRILLSVTAEFAAIYDPKLQAFVVVYSDLVRIEIGSLIRDSDPIII